MALKIDYRLVGAGWAECTVEHAASKCYLSASYLSDALGNLVLAAVGVLAGLHCVETSFDEEPGEFRWAVEWHDNTDVHVRVLRFDELWGNRLSAEGKELLGFTCHPLVFGEAVHKAASIVLAQHGLAGYKEKWVRHDFPQKQLELLHSYIQRWHANH